MFDDKGKIHSSNDNDMEFLDTAIFYRELPGSLLQVPWHKSILGCLRNNDTSGCLDFSIQTDNGFIFRNFLVWEQPFERLQPLKDY